jgi:exopolyphosphatase / guanosine-5'-triphosphate,3'-diphosphate pyrophosphatase
VSHHRFALGSSGTIQAVIGFASSGGRQVGTKEIEAAVEELADMKLEQRRKRFDSRRAEIVVAGAVILEAVMRHLRVERVSAVEQGLRNGVLIDLLRRSAPDHRGTTGDAALALGRRFHFDEKHARQVARIALALFEGLAPLHRLPAFARGILEAAAILHDVGNAVSYQRHHKHTYYLVKHADIPGFADRERELVALVARYHRRSAPERHRADLEGLSASEFLLVRKCAALLRLADALDRSHHQPVRDLKTVTRDGAVQLRLTGEGPLDLELWDAERESALFRRVFGRRLELGLARR